MPLRTKGLSWHTSTSGNKQKPAFQGCVENPPRGYPTTRRLTRVRSVLGKTSLKQGPSQATHFPSKLGSEARSDGTEVIRVTH